MILLRKRKYTPRKYNVNYELNICEDGPEGPVVIRNVENCDTKNDVLHYADEELLTDDQYFMIVKTSKDGEHIYKVWILPRRKYRRK